MIEAYISLRHASNHGRFDFYSLTSPKLKITAFLFNLFIFNSILNKIKHILNKKRNKSNCK